MIVGVPKEIKIDEYRVAMLPIGVQLLVGAGHGVLIQKGAGIASGYDDAAYAAAGATLVETADEIYGQAELVVKVKEPQPGEIEKLRPGQVVFCFFHFAGSHSLTELCLNRGISAVAYETLADDGGGLPLLAPMSEVAGKLSIQEGAKCLETPMMGRGVLLGGVVGVEPAGVLIIGGGVVGTNAARVAAGLGARVMIMDINLARLRYLAEVLPPNVTTVYCDDHAVQRHLGAVDLVIGAVLNPGGKAPVIIKRTMLSLMKKGAVLVDVSIDQGGCFESSHPTTHREPVFVEEGVIHYCVTNMPAAVGRTSSKALCNATLPYISELANCGLESFIEKSKGLAAALNLHEGKILCSAVAEAFPDLPSAL
ncbi:MAG: alanine dehydrogenase [Deltaproteobacteria bacterium]|nr:alanine dehydrogenase [Deltaproteobacteria bacterium]